MNAFNRKFASIAAIVAASLLTSISVNAAEGKPTSDSRTCHQVTKRVAVWPLGPKAVQIPKYETRTLTACDYDRAKPSRTATQQPSFGPRYR